MTPSLSGRMATMLPGVRPIIRLASTPTATIWPLFVLRATTEGSFSTIPRPRTYTRVFAVPRSTAMSRPRNASALLIRNRTSQDDSAGCLCSDAATVPPWTGSRPCAVHRPALRRLNEIREEDLNFPLGRFWRVRAVHDVLSNQQRMISPDGARRGGQRVRRPGQRTKRLNHPRALSDQGHQRPGGDEVDKRVKERFADVLGVVRVRRLQAEGPQIHGHDPQVAAFKPGYHAPDEPAAHAIGLYQDECAVRQ